MMFLFVSFLLVALFVGAAIWHRYLMLGTDQSYLSDRVNVSLPDSISSIVYELPSGGWRWSWTIWMWLVGIFTCAPVIEVLDMKGFGFVGFFMLASLFAVGAWPLFDKDHRPWHYGLAVFAGILSQICVLLICPWCLLIWILMVWIILDSLIPGNFGNSITPEPHRWYDGKVVFIVECICYVSLGFSIIVN